MMVKIEKMVKTTIVIEGRKYSAYFNVGGNEGMLSRDKDGVAASYMMIGSYKDLEELQSVLASLLVEVDYERNAQ